MICVFIIRSSHDRREGRRVSSFTKPPPSAGSKDFRIGAKGPYCDELISFYEKVFGMRHWKKKPKRRRDTNVRIADDKGNTETAFLRRREKVSQKADALTKEQISMKTSRTALPGYGVPPKTEKYVTDEVMAVRKANAERAERRNKRQHDCGETQSEVIQPARKKQRNGGPRWQCSSSEAPKPAS